MWSEVQRLCIVNNRGIIRGFFPSSYSFVSYDKCLIKPEDPSGLNEEIESIKVMIQLRMIYWIIING